LAAPRATGRCGRGDGRHRTVSGSPGWTRTCTTTKVPTPDGPPTELAHIYHFAGQVGRALFMGQGRTNTGETLYIGVGTDYGYMRGAYIVGSGATQHGLYSHN